MPTVSLIIATYNRGERIGTTLNSVLTQTRMPDEILVVDDCSTDGTKNWIQTHYPNIRIVQPARNGGTSASRNLGAKAATGDVFIFLDHDDLLHPHAVETLVTLLQEFPEAGAAYADHRYVNTVSRQIYPDHHQSQTAFHRLRNVAFERSQGDARLYRRPLFYALLYGNLLQQPWAITRERFQQLGGFAEDIRYCEDWEFYLRITQTMPIVLSDRVISDHIIEGENLHLSPNQADMHLRVIRRVLDSEKFNPRVQWILRQRLGMYLKSHADRADTPTTRWRGYWQSFCAWPFDHVVAIRALILGPFLMATKRRKGNA